MKVSVSVAGVLLPAAVGVHASERQPLRATALALQEVHCTLSLAALVASEERGND